MDQTVAFLEWWFDGSVGSVIGATVAALVLVRGLMVLLPAWFDPGWSSGPGDGWDCGDGGD
jgi:hypothetical protein